MSRRVRVTVEGDATESPANGVLRVYVGASRCVMVDPAWSGVEVEDVEPPRVWTDGDVIVDDGEGGSGYVWTREGGRWHTPSISQGSAGATDENVNSDMRHGYTTVLRYQAGE